METNKERESSNDMSQKRPSGRRTAQANRRGMVSNLSQPQAHFNAFVDQSIPVKRGFKNEGSAQRSDDNNNATTAMQSSLDKIGVNSSQ